MLHALTSIKPSQLMDKKLWDFKAIRTTTDDPDTWDVEALTREAEYSDRDNTVLNHTGCRPEADLF